MSNSKQSMPIDDFESSEEVLLEDRQVLAATFSFRTYSYRENLFAEFERLVREGKHFDGLIIDLMQIGYTFSLDILVKFSAYARRLLKPHGVLLFIKADGAITLTRDDPSGGLTLTVYDSPFGIFARYPMLADYVCATISGIDRRRLRGGGSTLANHILYTSTPVLTERGNEVKNAFEMPPPQNWLLQLIDDYSTVESISRTLERKYSVPADETLRLLQELESDGVIFPIFTRLQFLSNCYHNRKPFRLGRYMVASGLISALQLQELLEIQQEEGWGRGQKTFLGLIAVRQGYLNTRQLEVMLNDQYLYGGYHVGRDEGTTKSINTEAMRDSMIGSLGAIDTAGLIQSLSTAQKTGLLTVENRDRSIVIVFSAGKPTHARLGQLNGAEAVVEFLVSWREGIFVFRDRESQSELDERSRLDKPVDRLLLDAALCQDQVNQVIGRLPSGRSTILERVWDFLDQWSNLSEKPMKYMDESSVTTSDRLVIEDLARSIDGLSTFDEVIQSFSLWPSYRVIRAVQLLMDLELIHIQQTSLFHPLGVFQRVSIELEKLLGKETNKALLEESLHYVHGNSPAAQRFHIDHEGRVSLNLSHVKKTGTPVSAVLMELRRWTEAYLAYCRRQAGAEVVNQIALRSGYGSLK